MTRVNLTRTGEILPLLAVVAFAGSLLGCESGGVGDPCVPEDEYNENFSGFKLSEENIESRSYQCESRICLVNHFQGRVSCPLGQNEPTTCTDTTQCDPGEECLQAGIVAPNCDPAACPPDAPVGERGNCNYDADGHNEACSNRICNPTGGFCQCDSAADCPATGDYQCQQIPRPDDPNQMTDYTVCVTRVCSKPQDTNQFELGFDPTEKLRCYVPGTNTPIATQVCGQCAPTETMKRDAENAVYCSCRCGPAVEPCESDGDCDTEVGEVCEDAGDLPDTTPEYKEKNCTNPNYNFCDCPDQYSCLEVRKNVGLGDKQISGFYCVKDGTAWDESQKSCTDAPYTYPTGTGCTTAADCGFASDQFCQMDTATGTGVCVIRGVRCGN